MVNRAVLIEAFSGRACAGNGAAVVLLERPWSEARLQAVATSLRQSETAFLLQHEGQWLLRWFTPSVEVPLCGHATLAALLALGHWGRLAPGQELGFHTRSGVLQVRLAAGAGLRGSIDLPGGGLDPTAAPADLIALLQRRHLGELQGFWSSALGYAVALLDAAAPLQQQRGMAAELPAQLARGLVLMQPGSGVASVDGVEVDGVEDGPTSLDGRPIDYRLRFFAPGLGIDEDPVTGSAHALVAPWWMERLARTSVVGWQCSDRPGGVVSEVLPSGMIRLYGSGHLLWDGTLHTGTAPATEASAGDGSWPADSDGWQALLVAG